MIFIKKGHHEGTKSTKKKQGKKAFLLLTAFLRLSVGMNKQKEKLRALRAFVVN
jgi:hypothetical protein